MGLLTLWVSLGEQNKQPVSVKLEKVSISFQNYSAIQHLARVVEDHLMVSLWPTLLSEVAWIAHCWVEQSFPWVVIVPPPHKKSLRAIPKAFGIQFVWQELITEGILPACLSGLGAAALGVVNIKGFFTHLAKAVQSFVMESCHYFRQLILAQSSSYCLKKLCRLPHLLQI